MGFEGREAYFLHFINFTWRRSPLICKGFRLIQQVLIKARIAMGMTQKELAKKMGVKEQQVQRDEANQYSSAGFHRIAAVAKALNIKIQETHVLLKS